jgi:toxin-antitoxin system PIN domain toxin
MILPDVNVLVYAFRDDTPHHPICRAWLDAVVAADGRLALSNLVLSAVVRITTSPRIFREPSGLAEAFTFCGQLCDQPHCQIIEPGDRHWDIFARLCVDTDTRGARVTDAWFAALAIEWGCEWITMDRGFARFPGLRWRAPYPADV